jgi:hypothetical protein
MARVSQAHDDDERRLREQLDEEHPPTWKGEQPGDTIVGRFVALRWVEQYEQHVVELETADGPRSVFLFHTALRGRIKRLAPVAGELVAIRMDGKTTSAASGRTYVAYTVTVDREAPNEADWSAVQSDDTEDDQEPQSDVPADIEPPRRADEGDETHGEADEVPF